MNDRSVLFTVTNITLHLPSEVTLQLTFSETAELIRVYKMVDPSELDRALEQLKQKD